jgi:rare lipoprotein A
MDRLSGRRQLFVLALVVPLLAPACAPIRPERPAPPGRFVAEGMASWYGPGFHGRRTASGERFDENALTAAHPSLPFGTRVRVVSLANGREVTVRINDRGPHTGGRIIDLARAAAARLDMIEAGVVPVRLYVLGEGS